MNDKLMAIYDGLDSKDKVDFTTFKTSIDIKCIETGETLFKGLKNKVIIPGSGLIARKLFDITTDEITPTYNEAFGEAMYTPEADLTCEEANKQIDEINKTITNENLKVKNLDAKTIASKDNHKVLLFCIGIDGCGTESSQVYPVDYRKWMAPENMIPFRYQLGSNDISDELRESYFGRTSINNNEYIAYYFKRFETSSALVQQFIDGTPIDKNIYETTKSDAAETYVELNLKITKEDVRDYFKATVGIDEARINTISLCTAYPVAELEGEGADTKPRIYFKDIRPLTKLNIPNEQLIDVTKGIEIIYHIYM